MTLSVDATVLGATALEAPAIERSLCRFDGGEIFAYVVRGNEFWRARDHELWALEHDDTLVSARSGEPLAYRRGKVYFGVDTDEPLYYERAH